MISVHVRRWRRTLSWAAGPPPWERSSTVPAAPDGDQDVPKEEEDAQRLSGHTNLDFSPEESLEAARPREALVLELRVNLNQRSETKLLCTNICWWQMQLMQMQQRSLRIQTGEMPKLLYMRSDDHPPGHRTINRGELVHLQRVEKPIPAFKMCGCPRGLVGEASFSLN